MFLTKRVEGEGGLLGGNRERGREGGMDVFVCVCVCVCVCLCMREYGNVIYNLLPHYPMHRLLKQPFRPELLAAYLCAFNDGIDDYIRIYGYNCVPM